MHLLKNSKAFKNGNTGFNERRMVKVDLTEEITSAILITNRRTATSNLRRLMAT